MRGIRLTKKNTSLIFTLLILLVSAIYQSLQSKTQNVAKQTSVIPTLLASQSAELVRVAKVIDGDTIELDNGQKVRYIGIDTPELHHPKKKLQCFGKEARDKNKELVEGKLVRMEKDISETDKYWRLLRYIYVSTTASPSGEFVNDLLVREGYAYASTFPPDVKFSDHFRILEGDARKNLKGLWSKCN